MEVLENSLMWYHRLSIGTEMRKISWIIPWVTWLSILVHRVIRLHPLCCWKYWDTPPRWIMGWGCVSVKRNSQSFRTPRHFMGSDLVQHQCLSTQMHFCGNGQKIPSTYTLYMLQRVSQLHNKPYGLRLGCYWRSCVCVKEDAPIH